MKSKRDNDYLILFGGAKISKRESNKVGLSLLFGLVTLAVMIFMFKMENEKIVMTVATISAFVGYFLVAERIIKK